MELTTKQLTINSLNFNVFDEGEGETILLLHGFPDSIQVWRKMIPSLLEKGFRVISYDQRGFGQTDAPANVIDYRIEALVSDAIEILKALQVTEKIRLVGHDWGAQVGWALSAVAPQLFSSYTAISIGHPASYKNDGGFEQYQKGWYTALNLNAGFAEEMYQANDWTVLRLFARHHEELDTTWIPDLSRSGRLTAALNWYRANLDPKFASQNTGGMPPITIPTIGIIGTDDPYVSKEQMSNSKKYLAANFEYHEISNAGHWLPLDEPQQLINIITQ